jgi:hypothetical protein
MIKVTCEIKVYEIDHSNDPDEKVIVKSHWNEPSKVVLTVGSYERVVAAEDLIAAIKNCTNTKRF